MGEAETRKLEESGESRQDRGSRTCNSESGSHALLCSNQPHCGNFVGTSVLSLLVTLKSVP